MAADWLIGRVLAGLARRIIVWAQWILVWARQRERETMMRKLEALREREAGQESEEARQTLETTPTRSDLSKRTSLSRCVINPAGKQEDYRETANTAEGRDALVVWACDA